MTRRRGRDASERRTKIGKDERQPEMAQLAAVALAMTDEACREAEMYA